MSSTQCLNSFSSSSFALAATRAKYFFFAASPSNASCRRSSHPRCFLPSFYASRRPPARTAAATSF